MIGLRRLRFRILTVSGTHFATPDLRFALLSLAYRQNTFWRFAFVRTNILRKQFPWQLRLFGSAIKLTDKQRGLQF
ncbi:Uncharacterised protein [Shigella flexneri]|nr:Uncharacterised protein [Shigella sonnei]SRN46055.1 Uncharacterised protein [Shigella flexneri]